MCRLCYLMTSSANRMGRTVSTASGRFPAHALRVGKSFATTWWRCVADVAWLRSGVASLRSSLSGISGTSPRCSRFWRSTVEFVCACIQCASTVAWLRFVRPSEGYSIISNALDSCVYKRKSTSLFWEHLGYTRIVWWYIYKLLSLSVSKCYSEFVQSGVDFIRFNFCYFASQLHIYINIQI